MKLGATILWGIPSQIRVLVFVSQETCEGFSWEVSRSSVCKQNLLGTAFFGRYLPNMFGQKCFGISLKQNLENVGLSHTFFWLIFSDFFKNTPPIATDNN